MTELALAAGGGHGGLPQVQVVTLAELETVVPLRQGLGLIVDATAAGQVPVATLARLARYRRLLCRIGGNLVLVADEATIASLRRTGLAFMLPCRAQLPRALQVLAG
jgi:hypothetical protein